MKSIKRFFFLFIAFFFSTICFAQDELIDIDLDLDNDAWYEGPWLWVGIGVFILLLVLILKKK